MDEITRTRAAALPRVPRLKRTPVAENAVAFAVLAGGGYAALRLVGLLFRALGVA